MDATEEDIAQFFGSIGVIKMDKKTGKARIFVYTDRNNWADFAVYVTDGTNAKPYVTKL